MSYPIKFIHIADLHLGKKQYRNSQRYKDYFKAFEWILNKGISEKVDFLLICGDFIDSEEKINPSTLRDIIVSIQTFQKKSNEEINRIIPIICIEGNHETPFFSDHTWLRLLADLNLIILLSGKYDNSNSYLLFNDYSYETHSGGKIRIKNSVIYGMSYYGSSTSDLFPLIEKAVEKKEMTFNILMMHFGVSGQDTRKQGHSEYSKFLSELNKKIDYLALGHFHIQYIIPDKKPWIFNPGSLEVNEITEYSRDHGAIMVEVFSNKDNDFKFTRLLCENGNSDDKFTIPNRRFLSFQPIDISESKSFEDALDLVINRLKRLGVPVKSNETYNKEDLNIPILYITISGIIKYSKLELDFSRFKELIFDNFEILDLFIINKVESQTDGEVQLKSELSIDKIEEELLQSVIEIEDNFTPYKEKIIDLISNLKNNIIEKPNYGKIKKDLNSWFGVNSDILQELIKNIEIQNQQEKKTVKIKKKKINEKIDKNLVEKSSKDYPKKEVVELDKNLESEGSLDDEDEDSLDEVLEDWDYVDHGDED